MGAGVAAVAFVFYRVVRTVPPTRTDFLSAKAEGKKPRPAQISDPLLYVGISVFESVAAIEAVRQRTPLVGSIVELRIPDDAPIGVHKTRGPGHWTLVGDPDILLGCVTRIV